MSAKRVNSFNKYPRRPLGIPKRIFLPEVARRKRAQTGSFSLNAADGQPRLGVTDDIVNLACHLDATSFF